MRLKARSSAALPRDLRASTIRVGATRYVLVSFARDDDGRAPGPRLTQSEHQIAAALLDGLSNTAISRLRGSSARTVANQVASIFRKLGVHSRAELAARWAQRLSPATR